MAAVTICSDFGAQRRKSDTVSTVSPSISHEEITARNQWLFKWDFVKILDMNPLGMIDMTLSLLPFMQKVRGCVVNVFSIMVRELYLAGLIRSLGFSRRKRGQTFFFYNVLS